MDILETIDLPTSTLDFTEKGTDKLLLEWVNATRWYYHIAQIPPPLNLINIMI